MRHGNKKVEALADRILSHQRKVDDLLNQLFEIDETAGQEVSELLQEGQY